MPEFRYDERRSGVKGRIAKAVLTVSVVAACEDVVDAGFDGVVPRAPDAAAAGSGLAAGGSGVDASADAGGNAAGGSGNPGGAADAGAGGNAAGGTGDPGGAAGSTAGTAPTDAADSNESAERDARGDTDANSPPVAEDGTLVIVEGTKKSGRLPSSDAEGDVLVHRIITGTRLTLGTVTITNATTGEFEYSSIPGRLGTDSFTYQVRDPTSDAQVAGTIEVTVVALGPLRAETDVVPITHDGLGRSVDIEGDTAVAGAWWWDGSPGAAYVMRRDSSGTWKVRQQITESSTARYGVQVALTGDWLIVTASPLNTLDPQRGEAYFYKRQNKDAAFKFEHKFQAPAAFDRYGSALSVDGDLAVIGAHGDPLVDRGVVDDIVLRGAAYVYRRNAADEWRLEKVIESPDPDGELFGWGVGVYGDTLAVSAGLKPESGMGPIHFFAREDGQWKYKNTSSRPSGSRGFGESIAVYGDNILVSNPNIENGGGHVEAYARVLDGWQLRGPIWGPEPDALPPVDFGYPVAMHGDTAVIAAFLSEPWGEAYVFQFLRSPGGSHWWYSGRKLVSGELESDRWNDFGYAVAFDGTTAVIGAPGDPSSGSLGEVYFFGIAPVAPPAPPGG